MEKNLLTIHQTDERMICLSKMFNPKNFTVPTHIFAPNIVVDAHTLDAVCNKSKVYCGRATSEALDLAEQRDIVIVCYTQNEKFQAANSLLTAEGTLKIMIEHSQKSIFDCKVLVMGFGRTGAAVVNILNKLDIYTDIATTSSLRPAHAFAHDILPMQDFDFSKYDIVINTVPMPIVKDTQVMTMRPKTVYIDLASTPAINLEYAKYLDIDADIYPALPARTCPYSSARAIFNCITEETL